MDGRLRAGLSFLELGAAVETSKPTRWNSPPSGFHLGFEADLIATEAIEMPLLLELSKPLIAGDGTRNAKSSFTALADGWHDFPRDVTVHTGVGFVWMPLALGGGFAFFQRIAVGNYSSGPKAGPINVFTLGAQACLGYRGFEAELGLASEWQHLPQDAWSLPSDVPREMFELTLRAPSSLLHSDAASAETGHALHGIQLLLSAVWTMHHGKWLLNEQTIPGSNAAVGAEVAFYLTSRTALISSLSHEDVKRSMYLEIPGQEPRLFLSGAHQLWHVAVQYRWHPLALFSPLFIQGGGGFARVKTMWNDLIYATKQHSYSFQPEFLVGAGASFEFSRFVVEPLAEFSTLLWELNDTAAPFHLGGFTEVRLGARFGVRM